MELSNLNTVYAKCISICCITSFFSAISRLTKAFLKVAGLYKFALSTFLLILVAGCASLPSVPISLQVNAQNNINAFGKQHALPVQVRIYQLRELSSFREATFRELWKLDQRVLGDSLLAKKELSVIPGSRQKIQLLRKPGVNYIGLMVLYRYPGLGKWRAYKAVRSQATSLIGTMIVSLNGNTVRVD